MIQDDIEAPSSSKNNLLSYYLIIILSVTILLSGIYLYENNKSDSGNNIFVNTGSLNAEKPVITNETIYAINASDAFQSVAGTGIYFLPDNDFLTEKFTQLMKDSKEKEITIKSSEEAKKDGIEDFTVKVYPYSPLFIFNTKNTAVNYDLIKEENPEILYEVEHKGEKYFAIKDPSFLGLSKEGMELDKENFDKLIKNTSDLSLNKDSKTVIFVEDPLCPFCAQRYLSQKDLEIIENYNTKVLWIPLEAEGHGNSAKIISFIEMNKKDNLINQDLLAAVFEKQEELRNLEITDGKEIIDVLNDSTMKNRLGNLKTGNLTESKINFNEVYDISRLIGLMGTPSLYVIDEKTYEITMIASVEELK